MSNGHSNRILGVEAYLCMSSVLVLYHLRDELGGTIGTGTEWSDGPVAATSRYYLFLSWLTTGLRQYNMM